MSFIVKKEWVDKIDLAISDALAKLEAHFGKPMPKPKLEFHPWSESKMAMVAMTVNWDPLCKMLKKRLYFGKVMPDTMRLLVNATALVDNLEFMLTTAIPHELAHLAAAYYHGYNAMSKGHGGHWKEIMRVFGVRPDRVVALKTLDRSNLIPVKKKRQRFWAYTCNCSNRVFKLSTVKHNKYQQGKYLSLQCRVCCGYLTFKGEWNEPLTNPKQVV